MNNITEKITDKTVELAREVKRALMLHTTSEVIEGSDSTPRLQYITEVAEAVNDYFNIQPISEINVDLVRILNNLATLQVFLQESARGVEISNREAVTLTDLVSTSLHLLHCMRPNI